MSLQFAAIQALEAQAQDIERATRLVAACEDRYTLWLAIKASESLDEAVKRLTETALKRHADLFSRDGGIVG